MTDDQTELSEGQYEVSSALNSYQPVDQFIDRLGMKGLNWLIKEVLDRHYPLDIFPQDGIHGMMWSGEHGGEDIDPGVKWVAHLREALRMVEGA